MRKTNKIILLISFIFFSVLLLTSSIFVYKIFETNIVPNKYIAIIGATLSIIVLLYFIFILKRFKVMQIIFNVLAVLLICVELFAIPKMSEFINFINESFITKYDISIYNVMVSSTSSFNSLEDIKGHTLIINNELEGDLLKNELLTKVSNVTLKDSEDIITDMNKLKYNDELIVIADSVFYDTEVENDPEYEQKVKIIGTIEIKTKHENKERKDINITKNSFVVYISGIDTRTNSMPTRSLSDVNILMVVNPDAKKVLLIHTPRDYYVQLHGTTGLRDKLTHAGTKKGGVLSSLATMEDLYNIEIPFYIRVNFKSVVKLVDAIGGIDIYNDQNYTVTSYVDESCNFKPGWNNGIKGRCALAFARERHAYKEGDRHRGENQEQVITRIIDKASSSKVILNKYSDILQALQNSFETNIDSEKITSLVKMQIDDMAKWTVDTYNVTGTGKLDYTYSYPNQKLSVMVPNEETVEEAKKRIKAVLD